MYKIAVLDYRFQHDALEQIRALSSKPINIPGERCPESEQVARTGDAEIVLVSPWEKINNAFLDACPNIKYIGLCGTSTANVDLEELEKRGIAFSNIISNDKESVAEYFFMHLVRLARGIGEYQWKANEVHELVGKNIGIIGLGHVGQAIAHMALAYKMKVSYFSPHRKESWEEKGVKFLAKESLLKSSEIVVLCSPTNVKVLSELDFQSMLSGSILVQACAGSPFESNAFTNWIKLEGNFAVFEMSAGEKNYQLYKDLPRVIFSSDVAGVTYESNQLRGRHAIENMKKFLKSYQN